VTRSRVFISHASRDKVLADRLVDLLIIGSDVPREQVFYTSDSGMGVPPGKDFVEIIRKQLNDTALVVQLISPAFLESAFCLCELGAQWVKAQDSFPMIVPPVQYDDLRGILGQVQVARIDDAVGLNQLHDVISQLLGLRPDSNRWSAKRTQFLQDVKRITKRRLSQPSQIPIEAHRELERRLHAAEETIAAREAAIIKLREDLMAMSKLKDLADSTDELTWEHVLASSGFLQSHSQADVFDSLVQRAHNATSRLPPIVKEVLYYELASEIGQFRVLDVRKQALIDLEVARGRLTKRRVGLSRRETGLLNDKDPEVAAAMEAVEALTHFDPSQEFRRSFRESYNLDLDLRNLRVWDALGLLSLDDMSSEE
jgi:TIR domain